MTPDGTRLDREAAARAHLEELAALAARSAEHAGAVAVIVELVEQTFAGGGTLFFCGNGGSAADAQHLAAEYVVRFRDRREGLRAMALTTDTSVLTAAGNDLGFEEVFSRQLEALAREGDLLFLHSTSGRSPNLLRAAEVAGAMGVTTVAMLARGGGDLKGMVDHAVVVDTEVTAHAQELHLALGHVICELVERGRTQGARP